MISLSERLELRAAANKWISKNLPQRRQYLSHSNPQYSPMDDVYTTAILVHIGPNPVVVGSLALDRNARIVKAEKPQAIQIKIDQVQLENPPIQLRERAISGVGFEFHLGDGIEAAKDIDDKSIDLLLTDPPYGISKEYTCETQVSRRLRKDGTDFIMPKGNFGPWDHSVDPHYWTSVILPKVKGWFVTFCAQAQIGEYCHILETARFNAVGSMVWQKTNPVPFNHRFKPINAWEALVIGKRPGTPFNGSVVHNVFVHKSPSPRTRIHPTQKPLPLVEQFVELFSQPNDLIYDPFAGSGTTVLAALNKSRRVLAYEKDQAVFNEAYDRVKKDVKYDDTVKWF